MPTIGCDYAWFRPDYDALRAEGITTVVRYAIYPGHGGKGMGGSEYRALLAAGFAVEWVMETVAQAASYGYAQGTREAQWAFGWADSIGWPASKPGYFVAEDPIPASRSAWPAIADYFRAVHDVDPGRPLPGAYGSGALCAYLADLGLVGPQWHVSTWPGCDRSVAAMVQEANGIPGHSTFGGEIDLDTIYSAPPAPVDYWGDLFRTAIC